MKFCSTEQLIALQLQPSCCSQTVPGTYCFCTASVLPFCLSLQSPPISKRRRGVPSPVMIPQHYQHPGSASYSPNVVPHPGALGPGLSGSPTLAGMPAGLAGFGLAGGMGPPGSRGTPTLGLTANNTGALLPIKQRVSSNGSGDPLLMPNFQVMDEGSPSLAPGGAFGTYGRSAAGGGRSSSMSALPGMPSMLMPGQQGVAALMVNRINSWHPGSMAAPGIDVAAAAAAAAGNSCSSPFAAMAGTPLLSPSGRGMSHLNPLKGMLKAEQGIESLDFTGAAAYNNMQQHHGCWAADVVQQQTGQYSQQQQQEVTQQAAQYQQTTQQHDAQHCQQPGSDEAVPAALNAQPALGAGLQLPGSPAHLLQDMHSNDSAAFQQMLEQIFDETQDDIISDPQTMHKLDGMITSQQASAPQQQQSAAQQAPGQYAHTANAAAAGLDAVNAMPHRSNTWPHSWPDLAADGQAPPLPASSAGQSSGPYACTSSTHGPVSTHPSGVPLPPRSISATGSGLNHMGGAMNSSIKQQHWEWGQVASQTGLPNMPGPQSVPGSVPGSGPPSNGGFLPPQQDMQALCQQLQQENIKLMEHVNKLQHRLNSHPTELPQTGDLGLSTDTQLSNMPAPNPDSDLPRLPPVRIGGSAGGATAVGSAAAGTAGWGVAGLTNEGSAGLGVGGSGALAGLGVDLSPDADGTFTPGGLLDDSHDGDLLQDI